MAGTARFDGDDTESSPDGVKKSSFDVAGQARLPVIGDYGTASNVSVRISLLARNGLLPGRSGLTGDRGLAENLIKAISPFLFPSQK